MASSKKRGATSRPAATTREGREHQLVSAAYDLAEEQIRSGTATSQVITHFLKLGSTREVIEQAKITNENALLQAKVEQLASMEKQEELYSQALRAMSLYQGREDPGDVQD